MPKPKITPLRWTIASAAREFALDRKTLEKRLSVAESSPGEDGCFSTRQILGAAFGDLAGEKLLKLQAERELMQLRRDGQKRLLVPLSEVRATWSAHTIAQRAAVMAQDCDRRTKDKIIAAIRDIPDEAYFPAKATD